MSVLSEDTLIEGNSTVIDGELFRITHISEITSGVMVTLVYMGNAN